MPSSVALSMFLSLYSHHHHHLQNSSLSPKETVCIKYWLPFPLPPAPRNHHSAFWLYEFEYSSTLYNWNHTVFFLLWLAYLTQMTWLFSGWVQMRVDLREAKRVCQERTCVYVRGLRREVGEALKPQELLQRDGGLTLRTSERMV